MTSWWPQRKGAIDQSAIRTWPCASAAHGHRLGAFFYWPLQIFRKQCTVRQYTTLDLINLLRKLVFVFKIKLN